MSIPKPLLNLLHVAESQGLVAHDDAILLCNAFVHGFELVRSHRALEDGKRAVAGRSESKQARAHIHAHKQMGTPETPWFPTVWPGNRCAKSAPVTNALWPVRVWLCVCVGGGGCFRNGG